MQCKKFTSPPVFGAVLQRQDSTRGLSRLRRRCCLRSSSSPAADMISTCCRPRPTFRTVLSPPHTHSPHPSLPHLMRATFEFSFFLNPKQIQSKSPCEQFCLRRATFATPQHLPPPPLRPSSPQRSLWNRPVASNSSHQSLPPPALKQSVLLQNIFINYGKYKRISLQKTITLTHPRRHRLKIAFCKTSSQR